MLKTEKLLVLIAARPMIRTVEIADMIDCDPDQVQPALQAHIDAGDLAMTEIIAPNGRAANAFTITRQFMAGDQYRGLMPLIAAQRTADEAIRPAPTPTPKPSTPRTPQQSMTAPGVPRAAPAQADQTYVPVFANATQLPPPAPRRAKLDLALDFLCQHGQATSAELRPVMGLLPSEYPSSFFGSALLDGRIHRVGRVYMLGASALAARAAIAPPAPVVEPVAVAAAPEVASFTWHAPRGLRWAHWSDSSIEIERDGHSVLTLTPDECVLLAAAMVQTTMAVAQ